MADHTQVQRTIPALLKYWSEVDPEIPAFIFLGETEDKIFSRGEIFEKAGKMASLLRRIGVSKGDVIAVAMYNGQNCPDRLICELGIQMAGCVTVEASADLRDGKDALSIVNHTNAKMIITSNNQLLKEYIMPTVDNQCCFDVANPDIPFLTHLLCMTNKPGISIQDILKRENITFMEDVSPEDTAKIETTSGTTGFFKFIPYSQRLLVDVGDVFCKNMGANTKSIFLDDRSMNWQPGFPFYYLTSGLTRVMINHIEQPSRHLPEVLTTGAFSHAFLTSEDIHTIYLSKEQFNAHIGVVLIAGQPVKKSLMKEALSFAESVINFYGSTETGEISHVLINNEEEFDDYCVGIEPPYVEIKIIDGEDNSVERGQLGQILIKTPRQTNGYLEADGSLSREGFTEDGWFKMNDLGYRDDKGRLYVTGRGSDVILRGDDIFYPHILERFLSGCVGVEDMAVVGVPDPVVHQEIFLIVKGDDSCNDPTSVAKSFIDELLDSSDREYSLAPKYFVACTSTLRTRSGKVDRKKLTKFAMEKLGICN